MGLHPIVSTSGGSHYWCTYFTQQVGRVSTTSILYLPWIIIYLLPIYVYVIHLLDNKLIIRRIILIGNK